MSIEPLTITQTESKLRSMIEAAGMSADALDLEKAWDVFIAFCALPIQTESDGILIEWGPIRELRQEPPYQGDKIGYSYSVARQFDDGDEEFEQLRVEWRYRVDAALDAVDMPNAEWCFTEEGCDFMSFLRSWQQGDLFRLLKARTPYETLLFQDNTG